MTTCHLRMAVSDSFSNLTITPLLPCQLTNEKNLGNGKVKYTLNPLRFAKHRLAWLLHSAASAS